MSRASDNSRRAFAASVAVAIAMVAQLVASRALRDGFFLTYYDATALPYVMLAASALSVTVVLGSARLLRRIAPARSLPVILAMSAALFGAEWLLARALPRVAAVTVYLHIMSLSAVAFSSFWSVVNERFDPYEAKRLMPRITGGATLGGVLGGVAAWWGASLIDIPTMIAVIGALNGLCAVGVVAIGQGHHEVTAPDREAGGAMSIIRATPYLQHLLALMLLVSLAQAAYDYAFKASAAERFASSAELVSFFALFYMALNLVTFVVQNGAAGFVLRRLGLSATTGALPTSGVVLGLVGLVFPGLTSAAAARGGVGVMENSLFRSGYELLYTPVLPERKRPTKALIDVGGDKLGTALGAGVTMAVLAAIPAIATEAVLVAGIAASAAGVWVTRRLHHGYIASLAERLRAGEIDPTQVETVDATTELTLVQALGTTRTGAVARATFAATSDAGPALGRTAFIDRLSAQPGESSAPAEGQPPAPPAHQTPFRPDPLPPIDADDLDPLTVAAARLRSGDPARAAAVLTAMPRLPTELAPIVVPLVDTPGVGDLALESLRRIAPICVGTLIDAALDLRHPIGVRRRLCDLLGRVPTQRCATGLIEMLGDHDFELRFRAASSLLRIRRANDDLIIETPTVFAVAEHEAAAALRRWRARAALDARIRRGDPVDSPEGRRVVEGVVCVWTLLLCVLDRDGLVLAIRALGSGSPAQRGTGLEYLEQVLPDTLFASLEPLFDDAQLTLDGVRTRKSILAGIEAARGDPLESLEALRTRVEALRAEREQSDG